MSNYICTDIHGQYELYLKMLNDINFSDNDTLYILGDIIDRGPNSIDLLLDIINTKNIICLLGNHELMMWDYFKYNPQFNEFPNRNRPMIWTLSGNGGQKTLSQFEKLNEDEKNNIFNFIENLYLQYELNINNKKILLSHSDFIYDKSSVLWKERSSQEVFDIVWRSPWRFTEYQSKEKYQKDGRLHIIGHVPTSYVLELENEYHELSFGIKSKAYIDKDNNIINIDCGCARINEKGNEWKVQNRLCCMNLDNYLENKNAFTYYSKEI